MSTLTFKRKVHLAMKVIAIFGDEVGQVAVLGVVPDLLGGVDPGSSPGRKPFDQDPATMAFQILAHDLGPMHAPAIPDQHQRTADARPKLAQESHDVVCTNVLPLSAPIHVQSPSPRRQSQSCGHRQSIMSVPRAVDRRLALGRPGPAHHRLEHEAALVKKDDAPPLPTGVFFICRQRTRRQRSISFSSRSRARRSGFWQLQPNPSSIRHTWQGWYCTPNFPSITSATRFSVHSSVLYPAAGGPRRSNSISRAFCPGESFGGRPGAGRERSPSAPSAWYWPCHRNTELADDPTARATDDKLPPPSSNRMARRRRRSSSCGVPGGLMNRRIAQTPKNFHYLYKDQ